MSNEAVYRTAPATPGPLKTKKRVLITFPYYPGRPSCAGREIALNYLKYTHTHTKIVLQ